MHRENITRSIGCLSFHATNILFVSIMCSVVGSAGTREQAPPIDQQSQATKATKSKSLGRTSSTKTKSK